MCQIDALQRLKHERNVIHEALANLPKTLGETYDRILLQIPREEQSAVLYTLHWIIHHNELYQGKGIPCAILLQAVSVTVEKFSDSTVGQNVTVYDEETLRELCGCLISITSEWTPNQLGEDDRAIPTVSLAHYTVREYLDLNDFSKSIGIDLITDQQNWAQIPLEIVLSEAYHGSPKSICLQRLVPGSICHVDDDDDDDDDEMQGSIDKGEAGAVLEAVDTDFHIYCTVSALLAMHEWPDKIVPSKVLSLSLYSGFI